MPTAPLILLVEDDVAIREAVSECLSAEGYRVDAASDGAEALARLADGERPALLVLDLVMPVMNGAELVAASAPSRASRTSPCCS